MKRPLAFLTILLAFTWGLSALDLRVGPVTSGWNTMAVEAILEGPTTWFDDGLRPEVGLEVGYSQWGAQALVPVGLMWETFLERGWSWGAAVHGLAGTTLVQASRVFLWGAEGEFRADWSWSPGIGLGLSAGVRYSAGMPAPASATWEVPLHLVLEFALGDEEKFEPVDEKADHEKGNETK